MVAHDFPDTIWPKMITDVSLKLLPKQQIRIKLRILRVSICSKTINPLKKTDITDITDFYRVKDHGRLPAVHKSKHSR